MSCRHLLSSLVLLLSFAAPVLSASPMPPPRQVAITIDDLPWVEFDRVEAAEARRRFGRIIAALRARHAPATAFVNEDKLLHDGRLDPIRRQLLADWLDAGFELGNHTFGHVDLHRVDVAEFEDAIVRGEATTRELLAARGRSLRWFRHPFLHSGRSDEVAEAVGAFLAGRGYQIAPVTIDNGEWIYARAYLDALRDGEQAAAGELRRDYVRYLDAKTAYFEDESRRLLGREMPQILLIHANSLNADALPEVLTMLERRGYRFVDLATAAADPAYREQADRFRGAGGISWLHRWALTARRPRDFFEGEPTVPATVLQRAGVDGE